MEMMRVFGYEAIDVSIQILGLLLRVPTRVDVWARSVTVAVPNGTVQSKPATAPARQASKSGLVQRSSMFGNMLTATAAARQLTETGFVFFPPLLSAQVDAIARGLQTVKLFDKTQRDKAPLVGLDVRSALAQYPGRTLWVRETDAILAIDEVQRIATDPVILQTLYEALKAPVVLAKVDVWITTGEPHTVADKRDFTTWHIDKNFVRYIKARARHMWREGVFCNSLPTISQVFVLLSDCDADAGAHEFCLAPARTNATPCPTTKTPLPRSLPSRSRPSLSKTVVS
jgi:hypothetical protein